jgi:hypothetical protein
MVRMGCLGRDCHELTGGFAKIKKFAQKIAQKRLIHIIASMPTASTEDPQPHLAIKEAESIIGKKWHKRWSPKSLAILEGKKLEEPLSPNLPSASMGRSIRLTQPR